MTLFSRVFFLVGPIRIKRFSFAVSRSFSWRYPIQRYRAAMWTSIEIIGLRFYWWDKDWPERLAEYRRIADGREGGA